MKLLGNEITSNKKVTILDLKEYLGLEIITEGNLELQIKVPSIYQIGYELVGFFEVDEFTFSSGVIHGGGGMTFDGERTDDSSFDNVYESCDTLDFVCHFRNVKNWFLTLGRRISNGFESILEFFKGE